MGIKGAGRRAEGDEYPAILQSLGHNSALGFGKEHVSYSRDCQRRLGERLRRNKQSLGEIKSQGPSEAGKFGDLLRCLGSMSSMSEITVGPEQACAATGNHHRLPLRGPAGPPRHPDSQDDSPDFPSSLQEMCLKHLLKLTRTLQEPETHRRRSASRTDDVMAHVQKRCATQNYKKERW